MTVDAPVVATHVVCQVLAVPAVEGEPGSVVVL
jgi:hypothetical protein